MVVIKLVGQKLLNVGFVTSRVSHIEVQLACLRCLQTDYRDIIVERGEYRALVVDAAYILLDIACGCVHVEITYIALSVDSV